MQEIKLEALTWQVKGFWPWVPIKGTSMELGQELMGVTDWLPATVPGGVHVDLYRAGVIAQPYCDMNSRDCEWVENRWWLYRTKLKRPVWNGGRVELVFKGLDYEAAVYLNETLLGEHKGMFQEAVFDTTDLWDNLDSDEATLSVLLKHAPDEMAQIGRTSQTFTQKSRFNYKWDFSTRLVNTGIWDDVLLRLHNACSLDELHVRTNVATGTTDGSKTEGIVRTAVKVRRLTAASGAEAMQLRVLIQNKEGKEVAQGTAGLTSANTAELELRIPSPELWYPNGYGEQPLYRMIITLINGNNRALDERERKVGIRKLEYAHNVNSPEGALPYTVKINGRRIYLRGVNMTPLDHLYGNVTAGHYAWMAELIRHGNMNMVRVWGGGLIEKTWFYELCDAYGILVWQDFIQSSSGVDNIPSKKPEFLDLLEQTARAALADRRNHVSLAVWSGGNELMSAPNVPSDDTDFNLAMLKALVAQYDPDRLFLPTSASGPVEYITDRKGVGHDVHGHWKYLNNPEHYRLYGENDNLFHSEFGMDGLSRVKSLRKFLSPQELRPASMQHSEVWRHHGEWWDTLERDEALFGPLRELAVFADCSQWVQAEGLRFILEANRRRKFRNSGSLIWQLNEPWPNVSCTNLVDYYGETKMAYYWARKAFSPLHLSLDYRSLELAAGSAFRQRLYVHAHQGGLDVTVRAEVYDLTGTCYHAFEWTGCTMEDQATAIGWLAFEVPSPDSGLLIIRLSCSSSMGDVDCHPYLFSVHRGPLYAPALKLQGAVLKAKLEEDWKEVKREPESPLDLEGVVSVCNTGCAAALHVHLEELTNQYWLLSDEQYVTLLPGESRRFAVRCRLKSAGGFLSEDQAKETAPTDKPELALRCFPDRMFRLENKGGLYDHQEG